MTAVGISRIGNRTDLASSESLSFSLGAKTTSD